MYYQIKFKYYLSYFFIIIYWRLFFPKQIQFQKGIILFLIPPQTPMNSNQPFIVTQPIIQTKQYELSISNGGEQLLIRLVVNIFKNKKDIYQLILSSVEDFKELGDNFDGLQDFRSYIKDVSHIEVNLDTKVIVVMCQLNLKGRKKVEIASLPLNFSRFVQKDQAEQLIDKIVLRCKNQQMNGNDIKDIMYGLGNFLAQYNTEKRQKKQELDKINQRLIELQQQIKEQRNYRTQLKLIDQKYRDKKQEQKKQIVYLKQSMVKIEQCIKDNNYQIHQCKEQLNNLPSINRKIEQIHQSITEIVQKTKELQAQFSSKQNKSTQKSNVNFETNVQQEIQTKIKQMNETFAQKLEQKLIKMYEKINQEMKKMKINLTALENINGRQVLTQLVKSFKCQNIQQLFISYFESERILNLELQKGTNKIPDIIGDLASLQKLEIAADDIRYKIQKLPDTFKRLQSLTYIQFERTIENLSPELIMQLKQLQRLQELEIVYSPLNQLKGIEYLSQLKTLTVNFTDLSSFGNIILLPNLKIIDLYGNKIVEVSPQIRKMHQLQQLYIGNNPLPVAGINQMLQNLKSVKNLKKLALCKLKLIQIPKKVFQLTTLQYLDFSSNQLLELPPQISNLSKLKQFYINDCSNLTKISFSHIGRLSQLVNLWLPKTINSLPKDIFYLSNLESLLISKGSNLTQLPKQIDNLKKLKTIDIASSKLTYLPKQICNLRQITELDFSDNKIGSLPEQIGSLSNLTSLKLNNNKLTEIPKSLNNLGKRVQIKLKGNPIGNNSRQMLQQMKKSYKYLDF